MGAADRIAETILKMGQIRADEAQRVGQINAQQQANSAQIWGGALQSLGQIPGEIAKAKVLETENQIRQGQLDQQKKFQNDLFNANEIYQYTTRPGPDGSVQFDEDKLPGMVQKMSAAGINPDVVEHFAGAYKGMNQTMSSFRDTQLKHQADFANYMLQSASPEHPLTPATSLAAAKIAQANGLANADDVNKMMAAFNQGKDPTEVFTAIANYGKEGQKNIVVKKDERVYSPTGKLLIPAEAAPGEGQHVINGQLVGPDGKPIGAQVPPQVTPAELETQRHNQALEAAQRLQYGREAAVNAETARHNAAMETIDRQRLKQEAGPVGTVGANIPDVAPGQKNEDFLKVLPPETAAKVKALVEGRLSLPTRFAKGDTYWQGLLDAATKYDPSFDAGNYNARSKARTDLTSPSGTGGKTINAMNTALQHAGRLSDLIEKLDNYDTPLANAVVNPLRSAGGSTAVTNFNAVAPQLMKEIERAWRGSGGSSGEIQELIKSIGPNMGKQQQREALAQFVELLQGKLDSTTQQRDAIMGPAGASIPVLFKNNEGVIEKILNRGGGSSAAAPTAGRVVVGGIPFPSQAAADKALADWQAKQDQK
jgi:hypothetical protein